MKKALFIIVCNYRGIPGIRRLNVGHDMISLGGFFQETAGYDAVETVQDEPASVVLDRLTAFAGRLAPGDVLVIYYGGHGVQKGEDLLVLPREAGTQGFFGFMPVSHLERATDGLGLSRALILDCCRNDDTDKPAVTGEVEAFRNTRRVDSAGVQRNIGFTLKTAGGERGTWATLHACSNGETAPELDARGEGLFSKALHNVLRQASKDRRRIRVDDESFEKVRLEMVRLGREHKLKSIPTPYKSGNGTPELLGGKGPRRGPVLAFPKPQIKPEHLSAAAGGVVALMILAGVIWGIVGIVQYRRWKNFDQPKVEGMWENHHVVTANGTGTFSTRGVVVARQGTHLLLKVESGQLGMDDLFDDKSSLQPLRVLKYGFTVFFNGDRERNVSRFALLERYAKDPEPRFLLEVDGSGLVENVDYVVHPDPSAAGVNWYTADNVGAGKCIAYRHGLSFGYSWSDEVTAN